MVGKLDAEAGMNRIDDKWRRPASVTPEIFYFKLL